MPDLRYENCMLGIASILKATRECGYLGVTLSMTVISPEIASMVAGFYIRWYALVKGCIWRDAFYVLKCLYESVLHGVFASSWFLSI
jgi:hypothetical protein